MVRSSIAVLNHWGAGSQVALEVGRRVREVRRAKGLTQRQAGFPLTKSYVSAVERGRTLPSLGALLLLADHLGTDPAKFVTGVNTGATVRYTPAHDDAKDARARAPTE